VAAALRFGRLDDDGMDDPTALEPLMRRIEVRHDPSLDRHKPAGRPGRVTVTRKDGSIITREVIHPRGTPEVPATAHERLEKARLLLGRPYGEAGAQDIISAVRALPGMTTLNDLTTALRRGATTARP
jgi:2-methylcitrate dehydratase PrpD